MNNKILIIEDEKPIADLISYALKKHNFITRTCYEGKLSISVVDSFKPDLILLDLMLPDADGFNICKEITKKYNIPIIIITAKSGIEDKLYGLELGADDYITKPFDIREIIIRVKAIFRRIEQSKLVSTEEVDGALKINENISLYKDKVTVLMNNNEVLLTPKEYNLLLLLVENKEIVFSRERLIEKIWGYDYDGDARTVDIHIQRIRKKLKLHKNIKTVFGKGYKFEKIG